MAFWDPINGPFVETKKVIKLLLISHNLNTFFEIVHTVVAYKIPKKYGFLNPGFHCSLIKIINVFHPERKSTISELAESTSKFMFLIFLHLLDFPKHVTVQYLFTIVSYLGYTN